MKRLLVIITALIVCVPFAVQAASTGGVTTQGQGKFNLGFEFDYLESREMEIDKLPAKVSAGRSIKDIEIGSGYLLGAKSSYGLTKDIDLYIKLGIADYKSKMNINSIGGNIRIEGDADTALAYGIGLKGAVPIDYSLIIGADLQYLRHDNDEEGRQTGASGNTALSLDAKNSQWHIAPFIARQTDAYSAYCGFKYSDYKVEVTDNTLNDSWDFKAQDNIGVFLGGDFFPTENLVVNVEIRFIDETAGSFAAIYRF